jgi:succinoglycan biosynthesis protein ExoM
MNSGMISMPLRPLGTEDTARPPHICVCTCTYKRAQMLERLLEKVDQQESNGAFTFSIVVADNDSARSAEPVVSAFAARSRMQVVYCYEPVQNIALVRNKAIDNAQGDYIAFIDDDEFPTEHWLANLLKSCVNYSAAGVLGPVRPHFDHPPPDWLIKGKFCERREHSTGTGMAWNQSRTGNVLFRRSILQGIGDPFRAEFGTGGEDQDFFRRMNERGCRFVWCNEAVVFETVPPARWTRSYMFKRALLRGRNGLKHPTGRAKLVAQSLVAVPIYSLLLPVTLLFGQHVFVMYGIRFCDHFGRLLTLAGVNPINER